MLAQRASCKAQRGPDGWPEMVPTASCVVSLPQFLAMVFQDLLTNKDDYLRASRALLREIIKQTKHEIDFQAFCLGLMQERREPQHLDMEFKVPRPPRPPSLAGPALELPIPTLAPLSPHAAPTSPGALIPPPLGCPPSPGFPSAPSAAPAPCHP